ncbi:DUF5317 domain-containing protein [Limnochorda pilosa]|uniref:DUF5317 domain-containing protein n=1 Tax=Limnochorda pilosa TaxID=1555112 RepID=UPI0026F30495|nr:DUF5317 domain-containing protein [Limnochorda pilosa]
MLLDFFLLGMLVGWLRGGRLRHLASLDLRWIPAILAAFGLQAAFSLAVRWGWTELLPYAPYLYPLTFVVLLAAVWMNREKVELLVMGAGVLANFLAIAANGGKMPVAREAVVRLGGPAALRRMEAGGDLFHQLADSSTRLAFLGDWMTLPPPYPRAVIFSIGDVLIGVGLFLLIQRAMLDGSQDRRPA